MTQLPDVDDFLCRILRAEASAWPAQDGPEFVQLFLQRALHHGVQPLLYDRLRGTPQWNELPEAVREKLSDAMRANVAFDLLRGHELEAFLAGMRSRGIDFLLTKGEALARTHYSNPALRTRCDTDLFIDIRDIARTRAALLEFGYRVVPPIYKSHQFVGVLQRHGRASMIFDVHWRILNAPQFARSIGFSEALERAVPVAGLDGCLTLAPADALLLACMHRMGSAWHDGNRLIWLYDIHLLAAAMTAQQLRAAVTRSMGKGVQSAVLDGLLQAQARFHTPIPEDALAPLAEAESEAGGARGFRDSNLALLLDDLRYLPGLRARLGLLVELFFPAPGDLMQKYDRKNPLWLPLLYLRQILGGLAARLMLR